MTRTLSSRREFLSAGCGSVIASALSSTSFGLYNPPASPVSIVPCSEYEQASVLKQMAKLFDNIGGLKKLVNGKTVAIKINLSNDPTMKRFNLPSGRTYQTHFHTALAVATLLSDAGARCIRFLESTSQDKPLEDFLASSGWRINDLLKIRSKVEFEDTRNLGRGKRYHRIAVPGGGSLYPAYELNHSYVDCDCYISLAKMKHHSEAGVTMSMKNNMGATPNSIYGNGLPGEANTACRMEMIHFGTRLPPSGLPAEVNPALPKTAPYRVPRHIVDMVAVRPIDLSIIDGVETVFGASGFSTGKIRHVRPCLLMAGRNSVCVDSIAARCMGADPMAAAGIPPFKGDNHLSLAASLGLGTNDLNRIEVVGLALQEAIEQVRKSLSV